MDYKLVEAKHVSDFIIWVKFSDGVEGNIDLQAEIYGPVFEPLRHVKVFKRFSLHPELHTLVWENDADFSPEFLHEKAQEQGLSTRMS